MINRVIRDDPSKGDMHNCQAITPRLLWQSMKDYELWPLYALGLTWIIPITPPQQYLTLILRGISFDTFSTNLLIIPSVVLSTCTLLALTYSAEIVGELTFMAMISQIWVLLFLVILYAKDVT